MRAAEELGRARHLYVHVPFCAHRCGYCDFVTVVGRQASHGRYAAAVLAELGQQRMLLAGEVDTVFLGGGTPTYLDPGALELLLAGLPSAREVTVEANPETITPQLCARLRAGGVTRVSLGAQSLQPHLLAALERRADPVTVRRAHDQLRDAGFDNVSLDFVYGVPGQSVDDLARDLAGALELAPEHLSWYELEAKPGTRFTHAHGARLERQAEAMETYYEQVVETLTDAGYRWYETASFCRDGRQARHNLGYWEGRDYLGIGIGSVSTIGRRRWRDRPGLPAFLARLEAGEEPPREVEDLDDDTRLRELLMLALRLDRPVDLGPYAAIVDPRGVERMAALGLLEVEGEAVRLTRRGRMLGGGVTVELYAEIPAKRPKQAAGAGVACGTIEP